MMVKLNILEDNKVVMYNGISAAKAWFIMKYYGHPSTHILRGGVELWMKLDYPMTSMKLPIDYTEVKMDTFQAKEPNTNMLIDYDEVLKKIGCKYSQIHKCKNYFTKLQTCFVEYIQTLGYVTFSSLFKFC
jgi:3-mercaptopyruvate sulfurtransferase SseA